MFTHGVIGRMSNHLVPHRLTMPLLPPLLTLGEGGVVRVAITNKQDLYRASSTLKLASKTLTSYQGS